MDYFKQRREYRKLKQNEIDISIGQNNLYRELLDYANDEGKLDDWFPLKNSALTDLTGLSIPGLAKARNSLLQSNLIEYRQGKKNSDKPQYKIVCLYNKQFTTSNTDGLQGVSQKVSQPVSQTVEHKDLTSTLPKLDNNLTKDHHHDEKSPLRLANEYWGNSRPLNSVLQDAILKWCSQWSNEMVGYALELTYEQSVDMQRAKPYVNAILSDWKTKGIDSLEKAKANKKLKKSYSGGAKRNSKQNTNYGQTLYTYYEKELRFSPNLTLDEYVRKKRLNDRDRTALEQYIRSLEGNK